MSLKNALVGWLLIGGMVLYATALTLMHAVRTGAELVGSRGSGDTPSVSHP